MTHSKAFYDGASATRVSQSVIVLACRKPFRRDDPSNGSCALKQPYAVVDVMALARVIARTLDQLSSAFDVNR